MVRTRPAWRPVRAPSRRCEKKSSGWQLVHSSETSIDSTPARSSRRAGRLAQVEHPARLRGRGRAARRRSAPRRPPRSSRGRCRGRPPPLAPGPPPPRARTIPAASPRQPQWIIATPSGSRERHRQAVGDEHERRQVRARRWHGHRPPAVPGPDSRKPSARSARRGGPPRRRGPAGRSGRAPDRSRRPPAGGAVLAHRSGRSPVSRPRLRLSNGPSLTPPRRELNAARAPGSSASSHRTPSRSRQRT